MMGLAVTRHGPVRGRRLSAAGFCDAGRLSAGTASIGMLQRCGWSAWVSWAWATWA